MITSHLTDYPNEKSLPLSPNQHQRPESQPPPYIPFNRPWTETESSFSSSNGSATDLNTAQLDDTLYSRADFHSQTNPSGSSIDLPPDSRKTSRFRSGLHVQAERSSVELYSLPGSTSKPLPTPTPSEAYPETIPVGTAVNGFAIRTKNEPITGVFAIDPSLHMPEDPKKKGADKKRRKNTFHVEDDLRPNATFETKGGSVKLDLSVVGFGRVAGKARVDVKAEIGLVQLNITELHPQRHISLEVETQKGDIHLFVPHSYHGPIQLYSKRGNLIFLPILKDRLRIIKAQEDEALVMITPLSGIPEPARGPPGTGLLPSATQAYEGDYTRLTSKTGNIIVGLIGEEIGTGEVGWWKKMTRFFSGSKEKV